MPLNYTVIINGGPLTAEDNEVYFCEQEPVVYDEVIDTFLVASSSEKLDKQGVQRWASFTPNNGRQRGLPHKVPFERVVAISWGDS